MTTSKRMRTAALVVLAALQACTDTAAPAAQVTVAPAEAYEGVAQALTRLIEHEMQGKDLPAVSIALVDDQEIVWARGFGYARPDSTPATGETVHRVGSVSKLFTDIGIMQLVEAGEIDLDAPVSQYAPAFEPNTAGKEITLRQLMSHRSGLQREPAVGNYFDDTEPTLAATVASLSGRELVYAPEEKTKYSNAGIGVVGYTLEVLKGEPFA
ncbi:MAG: serine hydrolase domain-containing protein, partial [Longimicrobiales bacterium]